MLLGISINSEAVTAQYVNVWLERKKKLYLKPIIRHYSRKSLTQEKKKAVKKRQKMRKRKAAKPGTAKRHKKTRVNP
ncbi:hypothetical protein [Anaeromonas gelatinilytica]|uniref:hypothetical protein n=1 Tax=Anaeromonas gelatinilytica TaxID=2683194 RepID=UPI0020791C9C|nr:hypothetical protein [Anaeromonas gelatinilytica]